jgi:hypothetical protein
VASTGTTNPTGTTGTTSPPSPSAAVDPTGPPPIVTGREYFSNGARWRVELVELRRRETFLLVKARVTLLAPRPSSDSESAYVSWANGAKTTAEEFQVLDLVNKKRHLVARDPDGECVCTRSAHMLRLYAGQATVFEATFAAPPPDITKVEVVAPTPMGTFSDVPLS